MNIAVEKSYTNPLSNSTLLPLLLLSLTRQRHTPKCSQFIEDEYDYIVVGGGAAGSVVASRLSEKSCVSVLLLEAGPEPPLLTEVPGIARYFKETDVDWNFLTVPQKHTASGLVNRQIIWTTGKMLGGSASLNEMAYVRGNKKNYDDWAKQGAKGWSYEEVFPYFLKLEDNRDAAFLANGFHATGGPITVQQPRYQTELKKAVQEAVVELGYQFVDPNAENQTGFYNVQANVRDSQRCSSVKAYLVPAENRTNLDILLNAMVEKVIFENSRAVAVKFHHGSRTHIVRARREIIVSAGAVNTPKILMLSGVGPKEELRKFDIPLVADLPVGRNFHDHAGTHYPFTMNSSIRGFEERLSDPQNIYEFINDRTGPLAATNSVVLAFLNYAKTYTPLDEPDYELYFGEFTASSAKKSGLKPEVYKQLFGPYEGQNLYRCTVQQLEPKSRGTITLKSRNPFDPPVIDPNYLEIPKDEQDILEGLKVCKKMLNSTALLELGAKPFETVVPGCENFTNNEEEYFRCFSRYILFTFHHPAGSSKMGDPQDPTTVVDPELRVKNVNGLRVVDASVMPSVTAGNTNIPTVMIAEKASDMIKDSIYCPEDYLSFHQDMFDPWIYDLL